MVSITDYKPKTAFLEHQAEDFLLARDWKVCAITSEMGTGKSKQIIDNAAWLFLRGNITSLLIIAPNGPHRAWCEDQIPEHMPEYIPVRVAYWAASPNKVEKKALDTTEKIVFSGLDILSMNIQAIATKRGFEFAQKFLRNSGACMMVVDESSGIKNPSAICTKNILKLVPLTKYRRILNGTPVSNGGPNDLWAQYGFLDFNIIGHSSFITFKARYTQLIDVALVLAMGKFSPSHEIRQAQQIQRIIHKTPRAAFAQFELKDENGRPQYQRLEELRSKVVPYTIRRTKAECLDLPEKLYVKRYVELSTKQRRIYDQLKKGILVECDGHVMSAPMAVTKLIRLQQVTGGFFVPDLMSVNDSWSEPGLFHDDDFTPVTGYSCIDRLPQPIDEINPRIECLMDLLEETSGKVIIWARFRAEIAQIVKRIKDVYGEESVVEYHGGVDNTERQNSVKAFQTNSTVKYFVGHVQAGRFFLTLTAAQTVVYFSNNFSLLDRNQSEDRAHRIGQRNPVTYVDLVALYTLDVKIIGMLRGMQDVASMITGENIREWI